MIRESEDSLYEAPVEDIILDDSLIMVQSQSMIPKQAQNNKDKGHAWSSIHVDGNSSKDIMSVTPEKQPKNIKKSPQWPIKGKILINTIIDEELDTINGHQDEEERC